MLTKKQISEVREHLERAQNPLFLFDNDQDGLCSFLLLQRWLGRGKGYPVKTMPLNSDYIRRINELNADYVFILDVPNVKEDFFEEIGKINIPVVWIDHHENDFEKIPKFVNYYNPLRNKKKSNECVTALCYQISQRKEDLWLAVVGEISDMDLLEEYFEFKKEYQDLIGKSDDVKDIFYKTEVGRIARLLGYGLKDKTTNVIKMLKFLMKVKSPYEVLEENSFNREMHQKFGIIDKKLMKFVNKAKDLEAGENFLFFEYGGDTSMSGEISNYLRYIFPKKIIFVAYVKDTIVNISGRGENVRGILTEVLENFENATGGGHEMAVGARIQKKDLEKFKKLLVEEAEKNL